MADTSFLFIHTSWVALMQALAVFQDPQGAKYLRLLTIFAFGVYDDYLSAQEELLPLDEAATKKLRLLTLASMASKEKLIAYADLQKSLHIDSVRELEDLIIEGASQNVVQGKLDQKNRVAIQLVIWPPKSWPKSWPKSFYSTRR